MAVHIASLFNPKAKLWVAGRKGIFDKLKKAIPENEPIIWMHCASLGEFEQGRPVLEKLKETFPTHKMLLTFFSPSGYEIRKNYTGADWVFYLPLDTPSNARQFIEIVQPELAVFVKYEYWYNYLNILHLQNIPTILISAIFREKDVFFRWYGSLHRKILQFFSHLFVQNEDSLNRVAAIVPAAKITLAGDTRFDRVQSIAGDFEPLPLIEKYVQNRQIMVAGSTWLDDENMLKKLLDIENNLSLIIAPHEIADQHLNFLKTLFKESVFYSALKELPEEQWSALPRVLIIDNIGMLSKLYYYSSIGYIGGGFNKSGIHNTLEAAVYGKPVVFGPNYQKFAEAINLIKIKGGFSYNNDNELFDIIRKLLTGPEQLKSMGNNARTFVNKNTGATQIISDWIRKNAF